MTSKQFRRNPIYRNRLEDRQGPPAARARWAVSLHFRALGGRIAAVLAPVPSLRSHSYHKALLSTLRARAAQHDADSGARAQHAVDAAK